MRHTSRYALTCTIAILAAACSDAPDAGWAGTIDTTTTGTVVVTNPPQGIWSQDEIPVLTETLRIGSALDEGPALFGRLAGLAVDPEGRIHVLDRQAKEVRTFGPDGRHHRTVGRQGGGPGEFEDPIGIALGPGRETLYVPDTRNARYTVLSTDGEYRTAHPRRVGGYALPWNGGFGANGRFHETLFANSQKVVIRFDSSFMPVDTVPFPAFDAPQFELTTEGARMTAGVPFATNQIERWDPRGFLWTVTTGDYRIAQLDMAGDTIRLIHGPAVEPIPVTAEEREEALEQLDWFRRQGGRVDPSQIPSEKPPLRDFTIDGGGRLWVRLTTAGDDTGARYHVLDPEGRYLGEVRGAGSLGRYPVFRDGSVYGVTTDSMGVQYVVRQSMGGDASARSAGSTGSTAVGETGAGSE